jgi:manganese/zinc/iron transport system permease protein
MQYGADHVHDDAEKIEHVLGEDTVRQLERRLDFPQTDPHGKPIPGAREVHGAARTRPNETTGYTR